MNNPARIPANAAPAGADYLTEEAAAAFLGVKKNTLRMARYRGCLLGADNAPVWLRIGRNVMYRRADLVAWMEANATEHGASPQQHSGPSRTANAGGL